MSLLFTPIDKVDHISKEDFITNYLEPRKPLVIRKATDNWPAQQKWTFDYLKEVVGDKVVPLYDSSKADPSKPINAAASEMKFGDYIDLIQK
ncbi:MAG: cupin-like domain-containing protein, partial [Bacteroidia bacterium]